MHAVPLLQTDTMSWCLCRLSLRTGQTRRRCCCWRAWSCTRTGGATLQTMWAPNPRCSASCTSCSYPLRTNSWMSLKTKGGRHRGSRGPPSSWEAAMRGLPPMISSRLQTQATPYYHRWCSTHLHARCQGHKSKPHSCGLLTPLLSCLFLGCSSVIHPQLTAYHNACLGLVLLLLHI